MNNVLQFLIGIRDEAILAVDWSSTQLSELDLSSTDLSEKALLEFFDRIPTLAYLAVPYCDGFTDKVVLFVYRSFHEDIFIMNHQLGTQSSD